MRACFEAEFHSTCGSGESLRPRPSSLWKDPKQTRPKIDRLNVNMWMGLPQGASLPKVNPRSLVLFLPFHVAIHTVNLGEYARMLLEPIILRQGVVRSSKSKSTRKQACRLVKIKCGAKQVLQHRCRLVSASTLFPHCLDQLSQYWYTKWRALRRQCMLGQKPLKGPFSSSQRSITTLQFKVLVFYDATWDGNSPVKGEIDFLQ